MRHIPKAYERYRHFKGNCYQILAIAKDSEDASEQVVYQALYPPFDIYVRPLSMFMSEVDREKYPSALQRYRFELVSEQEAEPEALPGCNVAASSERAAAGAVDSVAASSERAAAEIAKSRMPEMSADTAAEVFESAVAQSGHERTAQEADAEGKVDENLMAFLDADTYEQKLKVFTAIHDKVTQEMLNTIAVSLDIEVDSGDLEDRYRQIQNCLMTFQKYECNRLR